MPPARIIQRCNAAFGDRVPDVRNWNSGFLLHLTALSPKKMHNQYSQWADCAISWPQNVGTQTHTIYQICRLYLQVYIFSVDLNFSSVSRHSRHLNRRVAIWWSRHIQVDISWVNTDSRVSHFHLGNLWLCFEIPSGNQTWLAGKSLNSTEVSS